MIDIEELLLEAARRGCRIEQSGEWIVFNGGDVPIELLTLPKALNEVLPVTYRRMKAEGKL